MNFKCASKICFFLAYFILIFETIFSRVEFVGQNQSLFLILEMFFILFSFILGIDKQSLKIVKIKKVLFFFLSLFIGIMSYYQTNNSTFLMIILFFISSSAIDFNQFIKFDMKVKIVLLLLMFLSLKIGLIENLQLVRSSGVVRNTFGFYSPNTMGIYLLNICCDYYFLHKDEISYKSYFFIIGCVIINYLLTNSRTSSICLLLLLIFLFFRKKMKLNYLVFVPYIFTILSFVLIFLYSNNNFIALKINGFLSDRLLCGFKFFEEYGIRLLGSRFRKVDEWIGYTYVIDNAFLNLFINHGLIMGICSLFVLNLFNYKIKNGNIVIKIIFLIFYISGLLEVNLFSIVYNPFLIYLAHVVIGKIHFADSTYN